MIKAKEFFKRLKAIAKREGTSSNYVPDPKGLTDERYFEAVKVGLGFEKDCSSVITGQETLRKIVLAVEYLNEPYHTRMETGGYPNLNTIFGEEDRAVIAQLITLLPKLNEMEAFAKAAWKAKIGEKEVGELLKEMGE